MARPGKGLAADCSTIRAWASAETIRVEIGEQRLADRLDILAYSEAAISAVDDPE
jgi:hypothetical protein